MTFFEIDNHFASRALMNVVNQAGKPTQNAFIESFNGKLRDECLNEHWVHSIEHARAILRQWRQDYNEQRPHSMLGYKTPAEVAEELRNQ